MADKATVAVEGGMIEICQFGAGRIGKIHAGNVAVHPGARLRYVVDVDRQAAEDLATAHGAKVVDAKAALADPAVDAVIVASSTDTHAELVEASARAGKAIFCEKPIDLDLGRVDRCLEVVREHGALMVVGFNRRFDPSFVALHAALGRGAIGRLELLTITSRDPEPPPLDYVRASGGLYRDMMIHDFDMARWLLGAEPVQVYAAGACLVDPAIGEVGDVDTAVVVLRTGDGAFCQISNSRRAVYGYDQRVEAFGAEGMLQAGNLTPTTVETWSADGVVRDKPLYFFLERYAEAYRAELDHFLACLAQGITPVVGPEDGRMAMVLAEAAETSARTGRPVAL